MLDAVSAAPAAATLPLFLPQAPPDKVSGLIHAATLLAQLLGQGRAIDSRALRSAMETAFCGTDAQGAWVWKDAYEALEAAQVMFLRKFAAAMRTRGGSAPAMLDMLTRLAARLPTQTRRSEESEHFQQFSTPIPLGFVAAEAAALTPADFVLEPSAGTGLLAIFAELQRAPLALNEIADTRAGLLGRLFRGLEVARHNAEQIHDRLDPAVRPSVVLMNPPFSASPSIGVRFAEAAIRHVRSAFARLADGGRLVAITGHNLAPESPAFRDSFIELQEKGRVVFTAAISGQAYARHGTSFETRLTVIDRVPAEDPRTFPSSPGIAADAAELLGWVSRLVPNRPAVLGTTPLPPAQFLPSAPARPKAAAPQLSLVKRPTPIPDAAELAYETREWRPIDTRITASLYEGYALQTIHFPDAEAHPTKLVQSAAMAAVAPPRPSYRPLLPPRLISSGILSDAQCESVVYAGDAHASHLAGTYTVDETYDLVSAAPADARDAVRFRRGWFLGDGTGAGKGRQVAAIILDNWLKGRRCALWISKSDKLIEDAERDWTAIGGYRSDIVPLSRFRQGALIALEEGILFTTYATLRTQAKGDKPSRVQQIIDWLGRDFDGVIVFDEAHAMANAAGDKGERGEKKPSQQGQAGLRLQHALHDARVLYVSATGATTVQNLAYAARLGLWGTGDFPFATRADFVAAMEKGGVAAMEVLARDLKALGLYAARSLSFEGIEYEIITHTLSPEQIRIYDAYADAFQIIHRNLNEALKAANITGSNGDTYNRNAKAAARSAFEANKQRFFNHLLTAMKCPTLINAIAHDLEQGHAIVLQIVSTNEALLDRRLAQIPTSEWADLSIDITPREYVLDYLSHSFPTQLFELFSDDEGNVCSRPAYDQNGNPVISREAVERRDRMIEHLASLPPVQGALDQILHRFGTELVAEVTGRSRRIVRRGDRLCVETRPASANFAETAAFMDDDKRILVFSDAGGTGRSYHADLACRNQRQRIHYLLEPGWRADAAIQGLGRSNRTNQKQPPVFRPIATDVKGEKRFLSTIARRLDTLGAITRGQRQTGGQGLFRPDDNLESAYAKAALRQFYALLHAGKIEGCPLNDFQEATGLDLCDQDGSLREELPPIMQFLNRVLALRIDLQNTLFAAFEQLCDARIEAAVAAGIFDVGVETLTAESFRIEERRTLCTYAATGAETRCYRVLRKDRNRPLPLEEALALRAEYGRLLVNEQTHRAAVQMSAASLMDDDGNVEIRTRLVRPMMRETMSVAQFESSHWRKATREEFSALWEAECAKVPEFSEHRFHIITGLLLPIWDRLPAENMRVYRFETDDGERVIGRLVTPDALAALDQAFGIGNAPALSPEEAWSAVIDRGAVLDLAGDLQIRRSLVMQAWRVELTGYADGAVAQLKALGLNSEIIAWRLRPGTGDPQGTPRAASASARSCPRRGLIARCAVISAAADLARRLARDAEAVCRHYLSKGRRSGRYWIAGDVQNTPGRSLYVRLQGPDYGPGAAGKWTDAATGEHGDLLDLIALNRDLHRLGEAMDEARSFLALPRPANLPRPAQFLPPSRGGSSEAARRLFAAGRPVPGTPAEVYLRARGITGRVDWPTLRFHPTVYYRAKHDAPLELWPALLAAVTACDGTISGVQRTWLDRERPAKAPIADPRRAIGYLLGNGVRFGTVSDIAAAGEGIETMLALKSVLPSLPMIAGLSANHLAALDLPSSLRRLYVARDNDAAGLRSAERLHERHQSIDLRELVPVHADFNLDLCRLGIESLRAHLADQLAPDDQRHLDRRPDPQ